MILITGASGNVGGEVLKQALAVGLKIRATFQSPDKAAKAPAGMEGVIMDYASRRRFVQHCTGWKRFFWSDRRFGIYQPWKRTSSKRCARLGGSTLLSFRL